VTRSVYTKIRGLTVREEAQEPGGREIEWRVQADLDPPISVRMVVGGHALFPHDWDWFYGQLRAPFVDIRRLLEEDLHWSVRRP